MSPGLDFETQLIARPDAPDLLAKELRAKSYVPKVIAIGTNTDPYQPIEKEHRIMRRCLEVLRDFNHPVGIVTKGTLIERDIDILGDMGQRGLVRVGISVTTLDPKISRAMEPRVPHPKRRLKTIQRLTDAGCPVRIMTSPVVPGLTDHEIEAILQAGADAGAIAASWIMLRLPREVAPLFIEWLAAAFPDRAARVMARVRETHGGQNYDPNWGQRMTGQGKYAQLIARRFALWGLLPSFPICAATCSRRPLAEATSFRFFEAFVTGLPYFPLNPPAKETRNELFADFRMYLGVRCNGCCDAAYAPSVPPGNPFAYRSTPFDRLDRMGAWYLAKPDRPFRIHLNVPSAPLAHLE
jgi:DNA repair photolyase